MNSVAEKNSSGNGFSKARKGATSIGRMLQHGFLDAFVSPRQFRQFMLELRRTSDSLFHPGIAQLQPSQIPTVGEVRILDIERNCGGMPPQDLYAVLRVALWVKPQRIFEIGTFNGVTTTNLAMNTDAVVYTLDLPIDMANNLKRYDRPERDVVRPRDQIGQFHRRFDCNGRIHQLFGDSSTFDFRPYFGKMDLVIVDACHMYDYVISDSQNALKLLSDNGAILWHDFANTPDVTTALRRLARRYSLFHIEGTWLALFVRGELLNQQLRTSLGPSSSQRTESALNDRPSAYAAGG
jgi:predicted O-methyltransferase YrrM